MTRSTENFIMWVAAALAATILCAPSHAGTITLNDGCLPKLIVSTAKAHPINLPHSDAKSKADPLVKLLRKKRAKRKVYSDIGRCSAPEPIVPTWFATIDTPSFETETSGPAGVRLPPPDEPTAGPAGDEGETYAQLGSFGGYDYLGGGGVAHGHGQTPGRDLPTQPPGRPDRPWGHVDVPPTDDGDNGGYIPPSDGGTIEPPPVPKVDVPEPDTAPLLVLGLIAVAISQRRGLRKVGGLQTR